MNAQPRLKLVVPKGHQQAAVLDVLAQAGIRVTAGAQEYRPVCSDPRFEVKLLKAANIPKLIEYGAHDIGFTGLDWITETGSQTVELLDTGLAPVRLISAAPAGLNPFAAPPGPAAGGLIVASEYERITADYMATKGVEYRYVRTYGATEVFPPEDADLIVDNMASGATLRANGLEPIDEILVSTTRLIAHAATWEDSGRRETLEQMVLLLQGVLEGRRRVLLDMNVPADRLDAVVGVLPAMRAPTIQRLHGEAGYAVRVAVLREQVPLLLPEIRRAGAMDILETAIQKVIA